jgi:hypothetical protein
MEGATSMSAQLDSLIRKSKDFLLDELSYEAFAYCKEVVLTKTKLDQAVKAGYPPSAPVRSCGETRAAWMEREPQTP